MVLSIKTQWFSQSLVYFRTVSTTPVHQLCLNSIFSPAWGEPTPLTKAWDPEAVPWLDHLCHLYQMKARLKGVCGRCGCLLLIINGHQLGEMTRKRLASSDGRDAAMTYVMQ